MTEREDFIAKMREQPDADTPRLVFADWLQERGEHDRAELIRVQVKREQLNPRPVLRVSGNFNFDRRLRPNGKNGVVLEFAGEFVPPVGTMLRPGSCFDAAEPEEWSPGEPPRIIAPGCVVERLNLSLRDGSVALAGTVTGVPCLVRREADALDARAGALMLRLPAGTWCPVTFNWHFDAETFAAQARNPEPWVLARRGFVEHVRCPWRHWLDWADWFRENHPCERVTLTTEPVLHGRTNPRDRAREIFINGVPGGELVSEEDLLLSYGRGVAAIRRAVTRLLARNWPGTSFTLPTIS